MSVGCYDVVNKTWVVGPEFKKQDFDPYSEYYEDDQKYIARFVEDIRNIILDNIYILDENSSEDKKEYKKYLSAMKYLSFFQNHLMIILKMNRRKY